MKRLLFQGDSITDCLRAREGSEANGRLELGTGYVARIAPRLPSWQVTNRGISGNRIVDLYARWKPDALHLRPDAISILIGVNDTWHEFGSGNGVEVSRYATIFRLLLEWTQASLPGVKLILCEPFVLPCGHVGPGWRKEIDQRRQVVKNLAADFQAAFVPFQEAFDEALANHPAEYWAEDGVHPTQAGHDLMADCWLRHANP
jgi:lysophospholipase L1-like esterase